MARLKISSSLENFKILIFFKIWALGVSGPDMITQKAMLSLPHCLLHESECAEVIQSFELVLAFPFPPYSLQKRPKPPNLSKICPSNCFGGVPVRGTEIWNDLSKFVRKLPFFKVRQIFPNFIPPDWNPPKQLLGQILDKFGVSGVFEGCKGEKGSKSLCLHSNRC